VIERQQCGSYSSPVWYFLQQTELTVAVDGEYPRGKASSDMVCQPIVWSLTIRVRCTYLYYRYSCKYM